MVVRLLLCCRRSMISGKMTAAKVVRGRRRRVEEMAWDQRGWISGCDGDLLAAAAAADGGGGSCCCCCCQFVAACLSSWRWPWSSLQATGILLPVRSLPIFLIFPASSSLSLCHFHQAKKRQQAPIYRFSEWNGLSPSSLEEGCLIAVQAMGNMSPPCEERDRDLTTSQSFLCSCHDWFYWWCQGILMMMMVMMMMQ